MGSNRSPDAIAVAALTPDEAAGIICSLDWECDRAMRVAYCESRFVAEATNKAGPYIGLFQVWDRHVEEPWMLYDPIYNTQIAYQLWLERGWRPWPVCGAR